MEDITGIFVLCCVMFIGVGIGSCTATDIAKGAVYRQCEQVGMAEVSGNRWIECRAKK